MLKITKDHLPWEPKRLLWVCPVCGTINAWNEEDSNRAEKKLWVPIVISMGSCFDNICGHCHADIVKPDSPILAPCYSYLKSYKICYQVNSCDNRDCKLLSDTY